MPHSTFFFKWEKTSYEVIWLKVLPWAAPENTRSQECEKWEGASFWALVWISILPAIVILY